MSIHWTTWKTSDLRRPLTVDWTPDDLQIDGVSILTHASIWIRPVATADRDWVHHTLVESGISDAIQWLDQALAASEPWQSMRHERTWTIAGQQLHGIDADGMQIIDRERGTGKNKQR